MEIDNELLEQIRLALRSEPEVLAGYIIGSTVTGLTKSDSDFDLVVVVKNTKLIDADKVYKIVGHLPFPKDLDLSVVDKTSSPLFLFQIVSQGKRIYVPDQAKIHQFEAFAMHNYYDTAHLRNIYEQALKQKFTAYAN